MAKKYIVSATKLTADDIERMQLDTGYAYFGIEMTEKETENYLGEYIVRMNGAEVDLVDASEAVHDDEAMTMAGLIAVNMWAQGFTAYTWMDA